MSHICHESTAAAIEARLVAEPDLTLKKLAVQLGYPPAAGAAMFSKVCHRQTGAVSAGVEHELRRRLELPSLRRKCVGIGGLTEETRAAHNARRAGLTWEAYLQSLLPKVLN